MRENQLCVKKLIEVIALPFLPPSLLMIDTPMQNIANQKQRGLRILSLDDGGVRGLSELFILREIMARLMHLENTKSLPKPCDYFDIIGGAGTGGVIALMLGRLRMPIDLAIEKYVLFSQKVFSDVKIWSRTEKFKATVFESAMRGIVQSAGFSGDVLMQEDDPICRSFVVALPSANMTHRIFRTYQVKANQGYNCTVVQAARATTATPDLFKSMSISSRGITETFVGAGLHYSNSINLALEEAVMAFGLFQPVACLVNIGSGNSGHISWKSKNVFGQTISKLLYKIATDCEAQAEAFARQYIETPGFFYRLSVHQGLQKMTVDDWNKQGEIQTHSLAYLQEAKIAEQLNDLVNTLYNCLQQTTLGALRGNLSINLSDKQESSKFTQALLPIVPAPSSLFTGRAEILLHLEKFFDPYKSSVKMQVQQCCVLYGLGGTGKTQVALQFCQEHGSRFIFIYMIDASSKTSIEESLSLLAKYVKLGENTPTAALMWLCSQKKEWLLIFDNADDPEINLQEFFPKCKHGNILITSRNEASKIYAPGNHYKIGKMTVEDSLKAFYKASQRQKTEEGAANELIQELGYLALAIVQAGSYLLYNEHIEVKQYLERYKKNTLRYLGREMMQTIDSYQLSVVATWDLSYQKLDEKAKALLMLCSVLHNSKIPVLILERAWKNFSSTSGLNMQELKDFLRIFVLNDQEWSDELVEEAINMLRAYSLVEIRGRGVILLEVHSLVHSWAFKSLSREEQEKAKLCGQQLFYCLADKQLVYNDVAQWVLHVQALMNHLNYKCDNYKLAQRLSIIFVAANFWTSAVPLQQQVLSECKQVLGSNSLGTIEAMSHLALTFGKAGKLQEAENLQQEVLKSRIECFGRTHPDTIQAMSNLASTFLTARKLQEAENLQQEVLKARMKHFGSSYPDTIEAMSDLGLIFLTAGKLQEAEELQQKVLEARMKIFGSSHPDTIQAMANLALTFCAVEKLLDAENLQRKVLKARIEYFGSSYPDTIRAMSNLAWTLWKAEKLQDAEKLRQQVLKARIEFLGNSHPDTIQAMSDLALTFWKAGKLQDAENLGQEVLKARIEFFGRSHPDTIQAMSDLALIFWKAEKLQDAENFGQEVLNARIAFYGSSHPDTVEAMSNLASIFWAVGKLQKAENLEQEVLKARIESFGSSHPDTIQAMSNLAWTLWKAEKLQDAENLGQEVLKARLDIFGKSHPDTIQAMSDLALILCKAGKFQDAKHLGQEVLNTRIESYEGSHPNIVEAMSNLASRFFIAGKLQEAENLQQEVLKARTKSFRRSHPDAIKAFWEAAPMKKNLRRTRFVTQKGPSIIRQHTDLEASSNTIKLETSVDLNTVG